MRQKSLNDKMKAKEQPMGEMKSDFDEIDDLLDEEGWDILNSLTEDEIAQLNSDFDPENMLIPTGERVNHERHVPSAKAVEQKEVKPMFSQKDLVKSMDSMLGRHLKVDRSAAPAVNSTLPPKENTDGEKTMFNQKDLVTRMDEMVALSKPVIRNEKIRQKEEERQKQKEEALNKKYVKLSSEEENLSSKIRLTDEEEELLANATEEELIEAAALLNMNDILTADQINAVFAGDKPTGGISSNVKSTVPKQARITQADVETDLDVVALNRHLKSDTEDLFFVCVNNQPKLENQTLELIIKCVATSKNMRHLSLAMIGLADKQCIALANAVSCNKQLETLNLDSNIIGMPGIDALMNAVSKHPTLREIKVSNQKQPFGGQGEECMASAIVKNQNILKFGYSFKQAAARNKADRAIIRNNEILRQMRRNGETAYDLKAVCKIRDPWPQPWIRIKGQRLLGSQLESKVMDMGLMINPDTETGRESRGPKVREEREAKPLDIAALLADRATKLKGTKVAALEKDTEERRKKTLLAMKQSEEESGRMGTMLKSTTPVDNIQQSKPKETLKLSNTETSPPAEEDKKTRNLREKGATKNDEEPIFPQNNNVIPEQSPEKKDLRNGDFKIAQLDDGKEKVTTRRKKKTDEEEPQGLDFSGFQTTSSKKEVEPSLAQEKKTSLGTKIVANFDEEVDTPRRRKKEKEEEESDPFKELEKRKKIEEQEREQTEKRTTKDEEERKIKEEEEDKRKFSDLSLRKASLTAEGGKKITPLAPVEDKTPVRRRKPKDFDNEPESDFLKIATNEESEKNLSPAEERAKALKERREALATKKADTSTKPASETATSDKTLSAAEQRAKNLKEKREALAAKKNEASMTKSTSDKPLLSAEEGAGSLKEGREKLAQRKSPTSSKPTEEATDADKPKIDIASSLGSGSEDNKPLSLKERRALLAEKKRQMGK